LLHTDGPVQQWLGKPIFRRIATLGYGVYLVHIPLCDRLLVPLAHSLDQRHVPMFLVWPLSLTLLMIGSLAMGYVLHVLVEKPSLRIRERLAA
jgi:peptidoglycan/LPS O-acetylase OafA/YrhL